MAVEIDLKVLDLFCGLKGWSQAFSDREHEVVTVDILHKFNPTIVTDIGNMTIASYFPTARFDVVLASPPCTTFSVASIHHYWKKGWPNPEAKEKVNLVKHTISLIRELQPTFWVLENPMGMLRKAIGRPFCTVTYCQYGSKYMKRTDLWGRLPPSFVPKCCKPTDKCHVRTPRGSHIEGTQTIARTSQRKFRSDSLLRCV